MHEKAKEGGAHNLVPRLQALARSSFLSGGKVDGLRQKPVLRIKRKRGATMADDKKDKRKELDDDLANLDADYAKLKADLAKFRADCEEIGPREI